jgi:hypothetical protein
VDTSGTTAAACVSPLQRRPPKIYFAPRRKGRLGSGSRKQREGEWKEGEDVVVIQQERDPHHVFSPHGSGSSGTH